MKKILPIILVLSTLIGSLGITTKHIINNLKYIAPSEFVRGGFLWSANVPRRDTTSRIWHNMPHYAKIS